MPNYKGEHGDLGTRPLQARPKLIAILRLCVGLVTIATIVVILLAFAAALLLAVEQILLGPSTGAGGPGVRLLRSVFGTDTPGVAFGLAISLLVYAALVLAVLVEARLRGHSSWRDLVAWHPWRTDRRVYILAAVALAYGFSADFALHYFSPRSGPWLEMPDNPAGALVLAFVAVVCAPVAEELLFRGWIYTDLRHHFGFVTTLVVTSAVFACLHYESTHLYALAVFPIGLALGTMREITGSVKPPIVFHAFNNFLATAFAYLGF